MCVLFHFLFDSCISYHKFSQIDKKSCFGQNNSTSAISQRNSSSKRISFDSTAVNFQHVFLKKSHYYSLRVIPSKNPFALYVHSSLRNWNNIGGLKQNFEISIVSRPTHKILFFLFLIRFLQYFFDTKYV